MFAFFSATVVHVRMYENTHLFLKKYPKYLVVCRCIDLLCPFRSFKLSYYGFLMTRDSSCHRLLLGHIFEHTIKNQSQHPVATVFTTSCKKYMLFPRVWKSSQTSNVVTFIDWIKQCHKNRIFIIQIYEQFQNYK